MSDEESRIENIAICLFEQEGGSHREWNRLLSDDRKDGFRDRAKSLAEAAGLNELVEALEAQWLPIGVMYDAPPMRRWLVTGKYGPSTAHIDSGTMFVHSWLNKDELPTHCMALPPLPNSEACESREPISPDALREIADGIANQNHAAEQRGLLIAAALTGDKSNG